MNTETFIAAVSAISIIAALIAMADRVRHTRAHRPAPAPAAEFANVTELIPGTRWLVCDNTHCAHLTTRHTPHDGGLWQCTRCGTTKGDQ